MLPLGQLLLQEGLVTQAQIDVALRVQAVDKRFLGEILVAQDFLSSAQIAQAVAKQQGVPYVVLHEVVIDTALLRLLPREMAQAQQLLPLFVREGELWVAAKDLHDIALLDYLHKRTEREVRYVMCDAVALAYYIQLHYYQLEDPIEARIERAIAFYETSQAIDAVALVDWVLQLAIKERATDIHLTPEVNVTHLSMRIDGVLHHYYALPSAWHAQLIARIKILSGLDIATQRLPQDGAFSYTFLQHPYDIRTSTLPTHKGENGVIRLLGRDATLYDKEALGVSGTRYATIVDTLRKPYGLILVVGPTGSGKTTTLYWALRHLDSLRQNILTVEDPIEYRFSFIKQTQINEKSGYTFAKAIKHFMRQDPDVMLVGEVRDEETAALALRASITGHLVLSTLHANSATTAITRLQDMGVAPQMMATALLGVLAQRLVRKVCPHCARPTTLTPEDCQRHAIDVRHVGAPIVEAVGCEACHGSGYKGRMAIVEFMPIDERLRAMIAQGIDAITIEHHLAAHGFVSFKMHGIERVLEGTTTLAEVARVAV
ncbi:MAG: hypothetical protein KU37_05030 [Sulfuricurvum sp. PC08-66]|nr:MAG: hypothetical protein KU37_05030 [Sulfuricurvum sp. PC08-66]